jgi:hypothetical protein
MSTLYIGKKNPKGKFLKNFTSKDGEDTSKFGGKNKLKCFYYKKHGHIIKDCKTRITTKSSSKKQQTL